MRKWLRSLNLPVLTFKVQYTPRDQPLYVPKEWVKNEEINVRQGS